MSALRLFSSVRGSLFHSWTFFVCATPSSVSGCLRVLLLQSVTRSDLRFSLSGGFTRWDESLLLLFAPLSSTPVVSSGFCRMFPGFHPCFCIWGFLSSFLFLPGFIPPSLLVGVVPSIFSAFFFSFGLPGLFVAFTSPVLCHSSVYSMGCFAVSFLSSGFLPSGYLSPSPFVSPHLVPSGFVLTVLVPALSFGLLFFSLVRPRCLACFSLGPFLRFLVTGLSLLVPLLLSFSPLGVSCPFLGGFFLRFLVPSLLRVGLFSSRFCWSVVLPLRLPRFHSLTHFAFVSSVVMGDLPDVIILCLFLPFGIPYCVI